MKKILRFFNKSKVLIILVSFILIIFNNATLVFANPVNSINKVIYPNTPILGINILGDWWDGVQKGINDSICDLCQNLLNGMFKGFNTNLKDTMSIVGKTPGDFSGQALSFAKSINDNAIVPIAGLVLTAIVVNELIQMIMEKNNMNDFETFMIFKWLIKSWICIWFATHAFTFTMALFDVANTVTSKAAGTVGTAATMSNNQINNIVAPFRDSTKFIPALGLLVGLFLVWIVFHVMEIMMIVVGYIRFMEIFITLSVCTLPFATLGNREWGSIGKHYIKRCFSLGIQGMFMLVCFGLYSTFFKSMNLGGDLVGSLIKMIGLSVALIMLLMKSGQIADGIVNA